MKAYSVGWGIAALFALACMGSGCGHFNKAVYENSFTTLQESAAKYSEQGRYEEVVYITRALLDSEPDNYDVRRLQDTAVAAQPATADMVNKSLLGVNLSDRITDENFSILGSILLYIPNRILDLIDLITVEAGVCFGIGVKAQATDAFSVGLQGSAGEAMFGLVGRNISVRATQEEFVHLLPVGSAYLSEARAYTAGTYGMMSSLNGLKEPTDTIYQRARDYWAIGAQAEALAVAANVKMHPVEVFDFIAGFLFFDPLKDDIGSTRPIHIDLTNTEIEALDNLAYQTRYRH
jgi:hypothetical protein